MTYKNFLSIAGILAILYGLSFSLMPGQLMSLYNVDINPGGVLVGRLFGATLLGFGILNWMSRDINDEGAKQAVLTGNLVGDGLGFIFVLIAQLGGVVDDVLTVVEDDKQVALRKVIEHRLQKRPGGLFVYSDRLGDRPHDQRGILDGGEFDEEDAIRVVLH